MKLRQSIRFSRPAHATLALLVALVLAACGGGGGNSSSAGSASGGASITTNVPATQTLSLAAQVGKAIFFDPSLSASGKMSCATCHDPSHAYGPPNALAVQFGGPTLTSAGVRAVPSLRYLNYTPAYADLLDNPDGISAPGPGGGLTWDGRASTLADQARIPLFSPFEMANTAAADVISKVQAASYAGLFMQAFGANAFSDSNTALNNVGAALQAFQVEDASFHPYTSKYDLYSGNKIGGTLTAAETRGLQVYTDAKRGNCSSCHYQGAGLNGSIALFTDFSYEAIGVPRNPAIPANTQSSYMDMGVCGPLRTDHLPAFSGASDTYCGMFKTPSLRNVATRSVYFHNGVITSLEQAIRFYNTRDTNPEIWYPTLGGIPKASNDASFPRYGLITTQYTGGTVQKFNDLPTAYVANIDKQLPLDGRARGATPPLSEQDIGDLLCFLNTLTDGYTPSANPPTSGLCVN